MYRHSSAVFGRSGTVKPSNGYTTAASPRPFGRRIRTAQEDLSFRIAQLENVIAELYLIVGGASSEEAPAARLSRSEPPAITVATEDGTMRVELEDQTRLFVLWYENGTGTVRSKLVTGSQECLLDHMLSHLVSGSLPGNNREINAGADLLVGQTLESSVYLIILRTVRHYRGDHSRAASALGIPTAELRVRLRSALKWHATQPNSGKMA